MTLEYLAKDGGWKQGVNVGDAQTVMQDGASGMTVSYHVGLKRWIAVSLESTFLSNRVLLRTAPELAGSWSQPTAIYEIPEVKRGYPKWDKDTWCYAALEHKEFARDDQALITYSCNSFSPRKQLAEMDIPSGARAATQIRGALNVEAGGLGTVPCPCSLSRREAPGHR